jgi:hypothetical protein
MATKATTAWGEAAVLEEVTLPQSAGEREFASVVQLLAGADGARYVRFAYTTDGTARRGPVTLREEDLARLRAARRASGARGCARAAGAGIGRRRAASKSLR